MEYVSRFLHSPCTKESAAPSSTTTSSSASQGGSDPPSSSKPFTFHQLAAKERAERAQVEYMRLCTIDADSQTDFTTSYKNVRLNRYVDILANEATIFPQQKDSQHYINANLLPLDTPHRLVAAQAPLRGEGVSNWWRAIVSHRITLIVMLTREIERGMAKADRYWPERQGDVERHGDVSVTLTELTTNRDLDLVMRTLTVRVEAPRSDSGGGSSTCSGHVVHHIQYLGWPDHGIPRSTDAFQQIIRLLEDHPTDAPVLVHCSAGIGRTGTLIAYYAARRRLHDGLLDDNTVPCIVGLLKRSRRGMVQRLDQYHFVYMCLVRDVEASLATRTASAM